MAIWGEGERSRGRRTSRVSTYGHAGANQTRSSPDKIENAQQRGSPGTLWPLVSVVCCNEAQDRTPALLYRQSKISEPGVRVCRPIVEMGHHGERLLAKHRQERAVRWIVAVWIAQLVQDLVAGIRRQKGL